jgi:hypothetical protein
MLNTNTYMGCGNSFLVKVYSIGLTPGHRRKKVSFLFSTSILSLSRLCQSTSFEKLGKVVEKQFSIKDFYNYSVFHQLRQAKSTNDGLILS